MANPLDKIYGTLVGGAVNATGTVTLRPDATLEFNQTGSSGSAASSRIREDAPRVAYDPTVSRTITAHLSDVSMDANSTAQLLLTLSDSTGADGLSGTGDHAAAIIQGDGVVEVETQNDGTAATANDTTQDNAYVSGLQTVSLALNGTAATVTADDGTTEISAASSTNYPSGTDLNLEIEAHDANAAAAEAVAFDIDRLEIN